MNDFDDELRDALGAGGQGSGPTPSRPPFDDVRRRARRAQRRRSRALSGGVLVVVLAAGGVAWVLAGDDDGDRTDVVTGSPEETTTTATSTTRPADSTATTATTAVVPILEVPGPASRPEEVVSVDEHGRLVLVDAGSGDVVRELDAQGDPTRPEPEAEIPPNVLDDVALTPDGVVYYTSVGEPVSGAVQRIRVDGARLVDGEQYWSQGNDVAVRPDGGAVAAAYNFDVAVLPTASAAYPSNGYQLFGGWAGENGQLGAVDWSVDGTWIAVARLDWGGLSGSPTHYDILVAPAGGAGPDDTTVVRAEGEGRTYTDPAFRRDGGLVVAEQDWCDADRAPNACGNAIARVLDPASGEVLASFEYGTDAAVVDQSYDATGTWLLVTFDDGTLRWFGSGQTGTVPGRFRAADW